MYFIDIEPSYFSCSGCITAFLKKKMGHRVQERIAYEFMLCMQPIPFHLQEKLTGLKKLAFLKSRLLVIFIKNLHDDLHHSGL